MRPRYIDVLLTQQCKAVSPSPPRRAWINPGGHKAAFCPMIHANSPNTQHKILQTQNIKLEFMWEEADNMCWTWLRSPLQSGNNCCCWWWTWWVFQAKPIFGGNSSKAANEILRAPRLSRSKSRGEKAIWRRMNERGLLTRRLDGIREGKAGNV